MVCPLCLGMICWLCSWCKQSWSLLWFGIVLAPGWELFYPLLSAHLQIGSAERFIVLGNLINVGQFVSKCSAIFFPVTATLFRIMLCVPGKKSRYIGKPACDACVLGEVLLWIYHWEWELLREYGGILWQHGCGYSWCCLTEMELWSAVRKSYCIYDGILMRGWQERGPFTRRRN